MLPVEAVAALSVAVLLAMCVAAERHRSGRPRGRWLVAAGVVALLGAGGAAIAVRGASVAEEILLMPALVALVGYLRWRDWERVSWPRMLWAAVVDTTFIGAIVVTGPLIRMLPPGSSVLELVLSIVSLHVALLYALVILVHVKRGTVDLAMWRLRARAFPGIPERPLGSGSQSEEGLSLLDVVLWFVVVGLCVVSVLWGYRVGASAVWGPILLCGQLILLIVMILLRRRMERGQFLGKKHLLPLAWGTGILAFVGSAIMFLSGWKAEFPSGSEAGRWMLALILSGPLYLVAGGPITDVGPAMRRLARSALSRSRVYEATLDIEYRVRRTVFPDGTLNRHRAGVIAIVAFAYLVLPSLGPLAVSFVSGCEKPRDSGCGARKGVMGAVIDRSRGSINRQSSVGV